MIVDVTGTMLIPGNHGKDRPGNGDNPGIESAATSVIICYAALARRLPGNAIHV